MMNDTLVIENQAKQFRIYFERNGLTPKAISQFQGFIHQYYRQYGRVFPWRDTHNPYHILVSEIMLQQTQTSRVVSKYEEFISTFPDFYVLANAPLREVLRIWSGLGYNRRALALWKTAQEIVARFDGILPSAPDVLQKLPGVGKYTAAATATIAFNKPTVFIETNIRTVFLYFFFSEADEVADRDLLPLVKATLDEDNPREWYYALFDYGAMLKRSRIGGAKSSHYRRQSKFKGSNREIRGQILRQLLTNGSTSEKEIISLLDQNARRVRESLTQLQDEGFINIVDGMVNVC
jgi:A/G-specific adenine glycosylase